MLPTTEVHTLEAAATTVWSIRLSRPIPVIPPSSPNRLKARRPQRGCLLPLCMRWTGCRAIVISGQMDENMAARAFEMGACAALAKPLSLRALREALQLQPSSMP